MILISAPFFNNSAAISDEPFAIAFVNADSPLSLTAFISVVLDNNNSINLASLPAEATIRAVFPSLSALLTSTFLDRK
ncbi:hypothetical protein D3C86_1732600 [compost metagenome]